MVVEQEIEQEADDIESGVLDSSFDSDKKPEDETDPNYDPPGDHYVVSGLHLSGLHFEPCMYMVWSD